MNIVGLDKGTKTLCLKILEKIQNASEGDIIEFDVRGSVDADADIIQENGKITLVGIKELQRIVEVYD